MIQNQLAVDAVPASRRRMEKYAAELLMGFAMRLDRRGTTYLAVSIVARGRDSASGFVGSHLARTVTLIVTRTADEPLSKSLTV